MTAKGSIFYTITFKVSALIAVLIAILGYTSYIVQENLEATTASTVVINQSGKLRMLSQKMTKEALYLSTLDAAAVSEQADTRSALLATAAEFSTLLANVTDGNAEAGIPANIGATNPKLDQVHARWETVSTNIRLIAEAEVGSTVQQSALAEVWATNVPLLKEANAAVQAYQDEVGARKSELMQTMQLILFGSGALFLVSIGLLVWLTRPIRVLSTVAQHVGAGDYTVQASVGGRSEIGRLATRFDAMVRQVRDSQAEMAAQRDHAEVERERAVREARASLAAQNQYLADSVDTMVASMRRFAEGDLTVSVPAAATDDAIGTLNAQFNRMVRKTRGVIERVEEAASLTAQMVQAVNVATEELSQGTQTQTTQADTVATSVDELTHVIVGNADKANQTAAAAHASGDAAREGGAVVEQTVAKIHQIANVVTDSAATVERLGTASKEIGEIAAVINDIADQTNLLALNAAIEAARAGEQGRGFAVVADEVRKLAERTTGATRQIAEMIDSVQHETKQAVASMSKGREEVAEGLQLADKAGNALERIVVEAESVVALIKTIAASSEQQAGSAEQISGNVDAIASITAQSAGAVQEIVLRVNDMQAQVSGLHEVVQSFQLTADVPARRAYNRAA
ncbi:MAG: methyl-accepting chemotaxis protein [Bacteroidota bacterium]